MICNGDLPQRTFPTEAWPLELSQPRMQDNSPDAAGRVPRPPRVLSASLWKSPAVGADPTCANIVATPNQIESSSAGPAFGMPC